MIIDLINFLVERHRRWKYKDDYANDAVIKTGFRNEGMSYKIKDKSVEIEFYYPTVCLTSINKWSSGEDITPSEKSLMFIDILYYLADYGSKPIVAIEKNHNDKDFWLDLTERHRYRIDKVELFDQEEQFQGYIDDLAKAFALGKTITVDDNIIDNRTDLEIAFRKKFKE